MARGEAPNRYMIQSVDRAIRVLDAFTDLNQQMTLGEIADVIGVSKPGAFRLLATLEHHGLVAKADSGATYSLGFGVLRLAGVRLRQTDIREIALPHMRRFRDETNETVVLCLRVGDHRVHVEQCESHRPFHRVGRIGEHVPLYAGAASKILLSALSDTEVHSYLDRVELTQIASRTVTDREILLDELDRIRSEGHAVGRQERAEDTAGLAVPIFGGGNVVVAALQVPLLLQDFTPETHRSLVTAIKEVAASISRDLGAGVTASSTRHNHHPPD